MAKNPDVYLLYEYMDKIPFTVRMKICLDTNIDEKMLDQAARETIGRFPYFSVMVGLDAEQNYTLEHNDKPIKVLPEADERIALGSDRVNGHLVFISYRENCIWFNFSHALCGAFGALFWVKATLYQYMNKKYGPLDPPNDIKLPGTPVNDDEMFFPDIDKLPKDEPIVRYNGGDSNYAILRMIKFLLNPFAKDNYYYQIEIPAEDFMNYAKKVDGSPNTVLTALMYKTASLMFKEKKETHISGRIAADYRNDIGADHSYRDFVRFIHVRYEWSMKDEPIQKLNMRARGAVISQNQPELSFERIRKLDTVHKNIDKQQGIKAKRKYASKNSSFRSDPRDNYTISYVGKTDWGEMEKHITGVFTITDGDLMIEVNALRDKFCLNYQLINKDRKPLELFCEVLEKEGIPYKLSEQYTRYLPKIQFPI